MKKPIRINATFEPSPTNFPAYDIYVDVTTGNNIFACKDRLSMEAVHQGGKTILAQSINYVCKELLRYAEKEFDGSGKKKVTYEELPDWAFAAWPHSNRLSSCNSVDESSEAFYSLRGQSHRHFTRYGAVDKLTYYEDDCVIYEGGKKS